MKLYTARKRGIIWRRVILQSRYGAFRGCCRYMEVSKPSVCYAVGTLREGGF